MKIKGSPQVEAEEKKAKAEDLKQDISSFFAERDKTQRGTEGLNENMEEDLKASQALDDIVYKDSLREVEIPSNIEPMFNSIFVTCKRIKKTTEGGILLVTKVVDDIDLEYEEIQKVMAVGPNCQQVSRGDEVCINFANFRQRLTETMAQKVDKKTELKVPIITIEDREYIIVSERDLKYIIK